MSYRLNYLWVFPIVILLMGLSFILGYHRLSTPYFFNGLKIITSGISVIALTISLVEVAMNRSMSKAAEKSAVEAVKKVQKAYGIIAGSKADFRIEIVKISIQSKNYVRAEMHLKEIMDAIRKLATSDELLNPESEINHCMSRLESLRIKISCTIEALSSMDAQDVRTAITKIHDAERIINERINK